MTDTEYLEAVLEGERLDEDSPEVKKLEEVRYEVANLLGREFGEGPELREGGSKAKGTMIRAAHDLDLPYYVANDDTSVGETIEEIYGNVEHALQKKYKTERRGVAVRLLDCDEGTDLSVDIIPGRFTNGERGDAFLFPTSSDKERLQTNLDTHISHVKESGVVEAVCLIKLWRTRRKIEVKTFAVELLTIEQLRDDRGLSLADQLKYVWTQFRDRIDELTIKDPANESGNDLSDMLTGAVREDLRRAAEHTLATLQQDGWEAIYGPVGRGKQRVDERHQALGRVAVAVPNRVRPWGGYY